VSAQSIRQRFPGIRVLLPRYPSEVVNKGAVLFADDPAVVGAR
jgi:hypothetical protein